MNSYNLSQAEDLMCTLRKFYQTVRIIDVKSRLVIYEELGRSNSENKQDETPVLSNLILSIQKNAQKLEAPITIDGQTCILELILSKSSDNDQVSFHYIKKLVFIDSLTNLHNRRFIDKQLPINLKWAFQNRKPISFIYADIDLFKKINDQYGHVVGDHVLSETANVFKQLFRRKDGWLARYGGDEFLFCLPSINQKNAVQIADRLRNAIAEKKHYYGRGGFYVTCSFGVQTIDHTSGVQTVNDVIELLDKKLYQAKRKGKNKVIS
ncbi:MAG: diguanylate cyclase [Oscillospiraceae bacterium]|nr:diguanylate cyclase [Oscillospiraceae bacterium]